MLWRGAKAAMERCKSSKNVEGGKSCKDRNWPGTTSWDPQTASAADKFESSLGAVRIARRTQGKWLYQSEDDIRALRASLRRRWKRSTRPFDCGWKAVVGE